MMYAVNLTLALDYIYFIIIKQINLTIVDNWLHVDQVIDDDKEYIFAYNLNLIISSGLIVLGFISQLAINYTSSD